MRERKPKKSRENKKERRYHEKHEKLIRRGKDDCAKGKMQEVRKEGETEIDRKQNGNKKAAGWTGKSNPGIRKKSSGAK